LLKLQSDSGGHFVSLQRLPNELEFGVDFNRESFSNNNPGNFYGQYTFLTLQNFALGKWDIYSQSAAFTLSVVDPPVG